MFNSNFIFSLEGCPNLQYAHENALKPLPEFVKFVTFSQAWVWLETCRFSVFTDIRLMCHLLTPSTVLLIIYIDHVGENPLCPLQSLILRYSLMGFPADHSECNFTSLHTFRAYQHIFSHEQTLLLSVAFLILRIKTSIPCKGHSQDPLASISQAICCACFKASAAGLCCSL